MLLVICTVSIAGFWWCVHEQRLVVKKRVLSGVAPPVIDGQEWKTGLPGREPSSESARVVQSRHERFAPEQFTQDLAATVPDSDIPVVLDVLSGAELMTDFASILMARWAALRPASAAEWVERLDIGPARSAMLKTVAVSWTNTDIDGAISWLREWPTGADREVIAIAIGDETVRSEPLESMLIAEELPHEQARVLRERAVAQWAAEDPLAAYRFAAAYFVGEDRNRLLANVAVTSVGDGGDGADAMSLISRELPPGEIRDSAMLRIVQEWAQREPARAAKWVADYPEFCAMQKPVIENLVALWTEKSSQEASMWIWQLGNVRLRDLAVTIFAEKISLYDPAGAAAWISTISDDGEREQSLQRIIRN